ncbi:protein-L-isoaspartate(D-aspartate) O-methyltransferase [Nocardiopsis sp. CT-R113]|uniref:Protein-L-isoaspartate O-methyltransferase n=1 Tax=Nocardiopsis codii TaxID=3065942 RepID=A0ABU7KGD3_9ACTN|nr:methyltransferase domain-containing protein [Nocardiopsis sp. CT-R113]MEE2041296.1 protein-L-isoaspartate(D-aspartate) O-methyltransferase [Nocardiopsis sp. CT-R113]
MDYLPLAQALADQLHADGIPEHIASLFRRVPRHAFLPDVMWGDGRTRYDRAEDPDGWMRAAYSDQPLTTQVDDGAEGGPGIATSSSSAPSVMARMLTAARIEPGHRVMEIGTGTGYHAALLCELVGDIRVTTIEIDQEVADRAHSALIAEDYAPELVTADAEKLASIGDGRHHRIIATCQVAEIPEAWLVQLHARGRLITPWAPTPGAPAGVLAVLEDCGGDVQGRFEGSLAFMWARGQRRGGHMVPDVDAVPDRITHADGDPRTLLDGETGLLMSLLVPGWAHGMAMEPGASEPHVWAVSTRCGSWARMHPDGRVEQFGPRRLAEEFAGALTWWRGEGRPTVDDFGLTVTADGCRSVWLREPRAELWTLHAADHDDADDVG